ncbi:precorrin-2 C(20)-methyltransferase [Synechococcus sp. CBW1107]|uniref:precorrin-2 C(20)-methyltransferase n=1 Tax=Synechococcus sp. CBW1107 TaxID=2789857 RepID=UPI002AD38B89|nr:precorrin-2 C(20)-methyltransferase [Synechococcus sp. CBW1107]CAK6698663.1 Siroheme synthase [Synechococcus sp. CBW1107]
MDLQAAHGGAAARGSRLSLESVLAGAAGSTSVIDRLDTASVLASASASGSGPGLVLVGVGPGDPELCTVAAVRAIQAAEVVAYPVARLEAEGMAARIASPWLRPQQRRLPLVFPMVAEAAPRRLAWRQAAEALALEVAAGRRVVLLCEGDVSLFASASYVLLALLEHHPDCPLRLIPGITAASAAAAAGAWPLALQRQTLQVLPTPDDPAELEALLEAAMACPEGQRPVLALLKLGARWSWVRPLLEHLGLLEDALFARHVGWPEQLVAPAAAVPSEGEGASAYFSLLLIRCGWPQVLPEIPPGLG